MTSAEETLRVKESYDRLSATYGGRVCAYRADIGRFAEPHFNEAVQTCKQHISYYRLGSHHQNAIFECRIKGLALGSCNLLLQTTRLWPESVNTMMWPFSFRENFKRCNILEIDWYRKTLDQKFSGVEFQILLQTTPPGDAPSSSSSFTVVRAYRATQ